MFWRWLVLFLTLLVSGTTWELLAPTPASRRVACVQPRRHFRKAAEGGGRVVVAHGCTPGPWRAASPVREQGRAVLPAMPAFTLPTPAALGPRYTRSLGFLGFSVSDLREQRGSVKTLPSEVAYHYLWGSSNAG